MNIVVAIAALLATVACSPRAGSSLHTGLQRSPREQPASQSQTAIPLRARIAFHPDNPNFHLSFGDFGPCQAERDHETHVSVVYCNKREAAGQEGVLFNFYLPGVWSTDTITPADVARQIRDSGRSGTVVEGSFAAPDGPGGPLAYHLVTTAVYPEERTGQVWIIKVAQAGSAAYSMIYSRMFRGAPDGLRARMREWLARNLEEYSDELARLRVDDAWVHD